MTEYHVITELHKISASDIQKRSTTSDIDLMPGLSRRRPRSVSCSTLRENVKGG
jgi:hypothetical protein